MLPVTYACSYLVMYFFSVLYLRTYAVIAQQHKEEEAEEKQEHYVIIDINVPNLFVSASDFCVFF